MQQPEQCSVPQAEASLSVAYSHAKRGQLVSAPAQYTVREGRMSVSCEFLVSVA